jgi:hypothetical protein
MKMMIAGSRHFDSNETFIDALHEFIDRQSRKPEAILLDYDLKDCRFFKYALSYANKNKIHLIVESAHSFLGKQGGQIKLKKLIGSADHCVYFTNEKKSTPLELECRRQNKSLHVFISK